MLMLMTLPFVRLVHVIVSSVLCFVSMIVFRAPFLVFVAMFVFVLMFMRVRV
jgi:hypothetical protein